MQICPRSVHDRTVARELQPSRCDTRLSGQASIRRVRRYTDLVRCVLVPVAVGRGVPWPASSSLRGAVPQALTLLGGVRFIARRLRHSVLRECRQKPEEFSEPPGVSGPKPYRPVPPKNRPCDTLNCSEGRTTNTDSTLALRYRLSGQTVYQVAVGRGAPWPASSSLVRLVGVTTNTDATRTYY